MQTLQLNTLLQGGRYKIIKTLGQGGFGITYLAEHTNLNQKVAIKEFFMNAANQRETDGVSVSVDRTKEYADAFGSQLAKFKKEYERLKHITNVHVVKVHECFEENGTAYYVMDFVEGDDLKSRLNLRGTPYAEKTVLSYLKQILDGLAAIHSKGLLHLDIKPANIMVTPRGYVKLIDLGASKDYMQGFGASALSGVARTDRYAPPEQLDGSYDKLGPWSDFYALGATIYHLLTRREIPTWTEIFEDKSSDKHIALPMPGVSEDTKRLVVWLMNIDREKRPNNVEEIQRRMKGINGTTVLVGGIGATIVEKIPKQHEPPHKPTGGTTGSYGAQEEPKFSLVGCLYILIIIAIIVCIIKFLFLT